MQLVKILIAVCLLQVHSASNNQQTLRPPQNIDSSSIFVQIPADDNYDQDEDGSSNAGIYFDEDESPGFDPEEDYPDTIGKEGVYREMTAQKNIYEDYNPNNPIQDLKYQRDVEIEEEEELVEVEVLEEDYDEVLVVEETEEEDLEDYANTTATDDFSTDIDEEMEDYELETLEILEEEEDYESTEVFGEISVEQESPEMPVCECECGCECDEYEETGECCECEDYDDLEDDFVVVDEVEDESDYTEAEQEFELASYEV